jgi:hypothetical protein
VTVPVALHATTLFEAEADCGHRGHDSEATARLGGSLGHPADPYVSFRGLGHHNWHYAPYGPTPALTKSGAPPECVSAAAKGTY